MTTTIIQHQFKDILNRSLDINEKQIKIGDWVRDAGKNESDRQELRKQMCGKVLYVDYDIIIVKPLTTRMKRIWGNKSVEFCCKNVLIVSEEEKKEIEKYFDKEYSEMIMGKETYKVAGKFNTFEEQKIINKRYGYE